VHHQRRDRGGKKTPKNTSGVKEGGADLNKEKGSHRRKGVLGRKGSEDAGKTSPLFSCATEKKKGCQGVAEKGREL